MDRMPGRYARPFCFRHREKVTTDCPESSARSPRQVRLDLKRELRRALQEALDRRGE